MLLVGSLIFQNKSLRISKFCCFKAKRTVNSSEASTLPKTSHVWSIGTSLNCTERQETKTNNKDTKTKAWTLMLLMTGTIERIFPFGFSNDSFLGLRISLVYKEILLNDVLYLT